MPTSSYQADWKVEIAFNAGTRTAATSYTWTDVSPYVELAEGIDISWGRQDERSTADANQLRLVFDNSDGRFTAGKTTGAYYPNVKIGRPIRVLGDPVDGAQATYFLGFINEWPTEWSGTSAYAKATITASSRLSRLGMVTAMKSLVETEIRADSPAAYYTLGEPADSTQANDSSGNGANPLTLVGDSALPVVFGSATGPGTDSLTAAQFAGGQYLEGGAQTASWASGWAIEAFVLRNGNPAAPESFIAVNVDGVGNGIGVDTSGRATAYASSAFLGTFAEITGPTIADGHTHHVALVSAPATGWTFYVDGVSVGTAPLGISANLKTISVGRASAFTQTLTGVVAHAAAYSSELSAARVAAHANAGLTGFAGETPEIRLLRYAGYAGIAAAEVNADADSGNNTMVHIDTTDKQVVELMRICETTEGGVLYDERDGTLTMHNRQRRYTTGSSFTLNMAEQEVEADYLPKVDRTGLANDVTAKNVAGTITAHRFDTTSQTDYGYAALSIETAAQDDDAPANVAGWNLYKYKDPKERVPSLTVDALAQVGKTPNCAAVMAATVGTKITVSNRPTQAATSSVDYFIEGGTISIGPELLRITWNLSPSSPEDQVFILGDPVRGVIGVNPIGF